MGVRMTEWTDEGGLYYYDEKAAQAAVDFFPKYLRLFEGEWVGKPFELMPFVEHIVRQVYGWKRSSDGTRRCRVCYIWIPRKNAKSTTAAGIALLMLLGDGEAGGQVYTIASTESQARIVFNFINQMVSQSPDLTRILDCFKTAIWCPPLGAKIQPLTGKPTGKHGLNASGIVGDEIHEWPSDDLYTYVHQSEGTRRQPLDVLISTAGKRDGVGWEHWKLCEAILNGEIVAPDTFVYIASADAKRDAKEPLYWATEEAVREANPGLGYTVKLEFLMSEIEKAKTNPSKINDIKRYYLNLWVDQAVVWLDMARWDECGEVRGYDAVIYDVEIPKTIDNKQLPVVHADNSFRWKYLREAMQGRRCMAGVDLSAVTDLTATVYVFPPDEEWPCWIVIPRFFLPKGRTNADIEARTKRDLFDYQAAVDIGALILTEGDVVDYDVIREDILDHCAIYRVEAVAIDRWNATQIGTQLINAEVNVVDFGQGFASMSAPAKFLERIVLQKRLDHGDHPVLRWCARNAAIVKDAAENMKPVKDQSTGRIDGIIATIMGIGVSDDYMLDTTSVYETRGVLDA